MVIGSSTLRMPLAVTGQGEPDPEIDPHVPHPHEGNCITVADAPFSRQKDLPKADQASFTKRHDGGCCPTP
jgi:hypothetical protein